MKPWTIAFSFSKFTSIQQQTVQNILSTHILFHTSSQDFWHKTDWILGSQFGARVTVSLEINQQKMKLYVLRFNMNIWTYIHMNIISFISTMTFCFNIPVFCHILDRCTSIVLNWCMFVIGIKFWKINQYMFSIHFYFTPVRPCLCVPWIYIMQFFIYLAAELFTQELFVWYDMHTYVLSSSISLIPLHTCKNLAAI